jgi:adenylylsulfate kinase
MTQRILIMGLPGAGKTTLAAALSAELFFNTKSVWINADTIREKYNDWDFSYEGRIRQAKRLRNEASILEGDFAIVDFVCPLPEMREIFDADVTVWVDTIQEGRYEDTNNLFVPPEKYDFRVTEKDSTKWAAIIATHLLDHLR